MMGPISLLFKIEAVLGVLIYPGKLTLAAVTKSQKSQKLNTV